MLVALLARPAGARIPYDERPAYQRAAFTVGALVLDVTPVVSGLVAPQCLPGYVLCKVGFALFNTAAAELHLLMSGFGDMAQTPAILYRGWAGAWYLIGRDVAGDHVPQPYPDPPPVEHRDPHGLRTAPHLNRAPRLLHLDGDALDLERLARAAALRARGFQGLQRVPAVDHGAEDRVLAVQPRGRDEREEELTPVGPRTRVRHREPAWPIVLHLGLELPVEGVARATGAVAEGIATLGHEAGNDPVEGEAVVEAELGEIDEVRHVHRRDVGHELDPQRALVGAHGDEIGVRRIEGADGRLGQRRSPVGIRLVDLRLGDLLVDHRDRLVLLLGLVTRARQAR